MSSAERAKRVSNATREELSQAIKHLVALSGHAAEIAAKTDKEQIRKEMLSISDEARSIRQLILSKHPHLMFRPRESKSK